MGRAAVIATATSIAALLGACVAAGKPTGGGACSQRQSVKTVFPSAKQVGFTRRSSVRFQEARGIAWPGRCVGWWTEYEHLANGVQVDYVDVGITLYKTPKQALAALSEGALGPVRVEPNGARFRTASDGGSVVSVMRNVMVGSTSSQLPPDANGIPDYAGGADVPVSVLMRIHRRIHAAILKLP
jgi:hypothetical protein